MTVGSVVRKHELRVIHARGGHRAVECAEASVDRACKVKPSVPTLPNLVTVMSTASRMLVPDEVAQGNTPFVI
jgi:hypothetical protein